jgi:hypothetical protein
MPERKTLESARKAKREGKSPSTQAGAFVHEEIEHVREGKHGARSAKQAIAIGLSKARRAGVKLAAAQGPGVVAHPEERPACVSRWPEWDAQDAIRPAFPCRHAALKREPRRAASKKALSRQARTAARRRRRSSA